MDEWQFENEKRQHSDYHYLFSEDIIQSNQKSIWISQNVNSLKPAIKLLLLVGSLTN